MLLAANTESQFDRLAYKLRLAQAVTPELMSEAIAELCVRLPLLNRNGNAATRNLQLIQAGAWLDASLSLVELELPGWSLRRLTCDSGEWHCSLSRQPNLPVELDDTVDASHAVPSLAILLALLEARRILAPPAASPVPKLGAMLVPTHVVCCDNFG